MADTAETALYERDAPRNPLPRRKVDRFTWRAGLAHPDEDARISAVFEPLVPALFACVSASYRAHALRRRDLVDPLTSDLMLGLSWGYVLSCLEPAIRPNLYVVDAPFGVTDAASRPIPSVVVGAQIGHARGPQLLFALAYHASFYRTDAFLCTLAASAAELRCLFLAAFCIAGLRPPDPEIGPWARQLGPHIRPVDREAMGDAAARILADGEPIDLRRWAAGVDASAVRAGLLVSGDLGAALDWLRSRTPRGLRGAYTPPTQQVAELLTFALSQEYLELREQLGVRLGEPKGAPTRPG
ncbi:MAG: hypothetical protein KC668_23460 [Myxococcales bacterium]|nr:hypothetical protein [Myxococcales bacterium]